MATATKRKTAKTLKLRVGNMTFTVEPVPAADVARANARIQRKVQPMLNQIKKTRKAATVTASKIVLNA